jgi:hypothetical protein
VPRSSGDEDGDEGVAQAVQILQTSSKAHTNFTTRALARSRSMSLQVRPLATVQHPVFVIRPKAKIACAVKVVIIPVLCACAPVPICVLWL